MPFKIGEDGRPEKRLVIIQCDSGQMTGDLIACARYRIYDLKAKADRELITHVLFVIHLPRNIASSSFVGFQGDPWISFHIDDLRPSIQSFIPLGEAIKMSISELFLGISKTAKSFNLHRDQLSDTDESMEPGHVDMSSLESSLSSSSSSSSGTLSPTDIDLLSVETPCYKRLHGCIQAAASKLKSVSSKRCTRRVAILVHLIPQDAHNLHGKDFEL